MVVTRVELRPLGGGDACAQGSVGRVVQSPRDATHSYRVELVNGTELMAKRDELSVLKKFQEEGLKAGDAVLEEYDLYQHVIYRCVTGSRAYGLEREGSDTDRRGIYLPPADMHWSLFGVPEQLENKDTEEAYWELQKFIVLALKANPNILECLYSPLVEHVEPIAQELLDHREMFLSKLIYQTYNRYVMSQFKKLKNKLERDGTVKWKHAMHLIRLLRSGITVLNEGFVAVRVDEALREELWAIRDGEYDWEEVDAMRLDLHKQFDAAFESTDLPERPDYAAANSYLVRARRAAL